MAEIPPISGWPQNTTSNTTVKSSRRRTKPLNGGRRRHLRTIKQTPAEDKKEGEWHG